jgi:hypothetical protein
MKGPNRKVGKWQSVKRVKKAKAERPLSYIPSQPFLVLPPLLADCIPVPFTFYPEDACSRFLRNAGLYL